MYPRGNFWCDLCDAGQNLCPLAGIGLRYLKIPDFKHYIHTKPLHTTYLQNEQKKSEKQNLLGELNQQ